MELGFSRAEAEAEAQEQQPFRVAAAAELRELEAVAQRVWADFQASGLNLRSVAEEVTVVEARQDLA